MEASQYDVRESEHASTMRSTSDHLKASGVEPEGADEL